MDSLGATALGKTREKVGTTEAELLVNLANLETSLAATIDHLADHQSQPEVATMFRQYAEIRRNQAGSYRDMAPQTAIPSLPI